MLYQVLAVDGSPWTDPDGNGQWSVHEADAWADHLEDQGHLTDVVAVPGTENVIGLTQGPDGVWALAQPGCTVSGRAVSR